MNTHYEFDTVMYKTVAKNINKYLNIRKMTITDLAEYAQIDKEYLEDYLKGDKDLTISIYDLYKISVILEVTINKFFL